MRVRGEYGQKERWTRSEESKELGGSDNSEWLALWTGQVIFCFIFLIFYKTIHLNECHVPETSSRVLYYHWTAVIALWFVNTMIRTTGWWIKQLNESDSSCCATPANRSSHTAIKCTSSAVPRSYSLFSPPITASSDFDIWDDKDWPFLLAVC